MFIMYMYLVLSRIVTISAGTLILFKDSHHLGQAGFFLFSKEWLFIFSEFGKTTLKRKYIHRGQMLTFWEDTTSILFRFGKTMLILRYIHRPGRVQYRIHPSLFCSHSSLYMISDICVPLNILYLTHPFL